MLRTASPSYLRRLHLCEASVRFLSGGRNEDSGPSGEGQDYNTGKREIETRGSMASYLMNRKGRAPSFLRSAVPSQKPREDRSTFSNRSYNQNMLGQRRRSKRRVRDSGEDSRHLNVSDEVKVYVNDIETMEDLFRRGGTIHEDDADDFDDFCAEIFTESLKTKDGKYAEVFFTKEFYTTKIPEPRTLRRIVDVSTPKVIQPVGSDGYELGQMAWKVVLVFQLNVFKTIGAKQERHL